MLVFSDTPGALFNILGRLGHLISEADSYQSAQDTNFTGADQAIAQLDAMQDIQSLLGGGYISQLNGVAPLGALCQNVGTQALGRLVFEDNPRPGQTLTNPTLVASIQEVIRQMKVAGATIREQTITLTPTAFTGTGNGNIVASAIRPQDGLIQQMVFTENLQVLCVSDSYLGGKAAGNEGFLIRGDGVQTNPFAFNWPAGSGAQVSVSAIDGNTSNGAGNLLAGSGFNAFTANVPDSWTLATGVAGTNIAEETTLVYDGAAALRIIGDGTTNMVLTQTFGTQNGTTLNELTQYSVNMWMRRDGTAAAAGVLTIDLIDANNTVVADANGTANSFTIDLTALTTAYVAYSGTFRTPATLSGAYRIRVRLSTALTSGRDVYLDKLSMGIMTRLYPGGPYASVHAGSVPFVQSDFGYINATNGRGAAGTSDTFATLMQRLYLNDMMSNELQLPYATAGSETVSDGLITT